MGWFFSPQARSELIAKLIEQQETADWREGVSSYHARRRTPSAPAALAAVLIA
ncbi:hypothetical protein QRD40_05200 [Comamonas sp. Y6]|uniref:Uncharacterized protein n=1 Tax=Comamonas resistens TaxID=3046670 RepID=A0ABY8SQ11_9BURK|nr:hypothetical protein [Comamonas resistens]MDL5035744.1 hypothetical protein [Comamonas resistens]WHS65158.1 hypothetical protein QMY55_22170 [Comamonas resistens]